MIRRVATVVTVILAAVIPTFPTGVAQAATPSFLFTVEAARGATAPMRPATGEDERFTLTLSVLAPVTKFADRPFRSASVISPAALVSNWKAWFASSPPNAVLTYTNGPGVPPRSIVVTLSHPHLGANGQALSFTASRTYRTLDPGDTGVNWIRPATPRRFASASLFIDNAINNQNAGEGWQLNGP